MRLVVNVQPLASSGRRFGSESSDDRAADALSLMVGVDCRVEDERVRPAVPASVYEADQRVTVERTDPRQAVALQPLRPFERSSSTSALSNASATTTTRPTGVSNGSTITRPPAARTASAASSTESTSQLGSYRSPVASTISESPSGRASPA